MRAATIAGLNNSHTPLGEVVGLEGYLRGYERIRVLAKALGAPLHGDSRIAAYGRAIESWRNGDREVIAPVHLHRGLVDLIQVVLICDVLGERSDAKPLIRRIFGGPVETLFVKDHDPARDLQFELLVGAQLVRAGARVRLAEPDLVLEVPGGNIALAAKRPSKITAVEDALRSATRQIRRSGLRGLAVIDVSAFPIGGDGLLFSSIIEPGQRPGQAAIGHLHKVMQDLQPTVLGRFWREEPERSGTEGILFHVAVDVTATRALEMHVGEAWGICTTTKGATPACRHLEASLGMLGLLPTLGTDATARPTGAL